MVEKNLGGKPLIWKAQNKEIKINNLKKLLDVLIKIKQENIDSKINKNLNNLINWLENNFPRQLELIQHLKIESKEYTPQQIRERIVRDLRKII